MRDQKNLVPQMEIVVALLYMSKPLHLLDRPVAGWARRRGAHPPVFGTVPHHVRAACSCHVPMYSTCPTGGRLGIYALDMAFSNQTKSATRLSTFLTGLRSWGFFFFKFCCSALSLRAVVKLVFPCVSRSRP